MYYMILYEIISYIGENKKKPTRIGMMNATTGRGTYTESTKTGEEGTPVLFTDKDYL
jgi:hypothetical protein